MNGRYNQLLIQVSSAPRLPCSLLLLLLTSTECKMMVTNTSSRKMKVKGGIPRKDIHLPPKWRRMGLLSLSASRYILGTMNRVMKKAKVRPKMMVQDRGFQKTALSPPK